MAVTKRRAIRVLQCGMQRPSASKEALTDEMSPEGYARAPAGFFRIHWLAAVIK
jgi:hypothetical protein